MQRFMGLEEAAERLAVSERTIRRLISDGSIEAIKFRRNVRVSENSLVEFVREHEMKPLEVV